jgi:hypothetical protein
LIENEASNTRFETNLPRDGPAMRVPLPQGRDSCFLFQREQPGSASHPPKTTVFSFQFSVVSKDNLLSTEDWKLKTENCLYVLSGDATIALALR